MIVVVINSAGRVDAVFDSDPDSDAVIIHLSEDEPEETFRLQVEGTDYMPQHIQNMVEEALS